MSKRVKLQHGEVYTYHKDLGFTLYDPLDYTFNGFDIKSLYEHYLHKKEMIASDKVYYDKLKEWLESYGYTVDSEDLHNLIDEVLLKVRPIKNDLTYHYFSIDDEGYIKSYDLLRGEITQEDIEVPNDLFNGCYYFKDNKILLDKNKYESEWL